MNHILLIKLIPTAFIATTFSFIGVKIFNNKWDALTFANYHSYMDPNIIGQSKKDFNIQFESLDSDKQVEENFKNNVYHAAIVSNSTHEELLKNDMLKKIDWTKFNLTKSNTADKVANHTDALGLYSENTTKILNKNPKQIEFGIPYFMTYISFFYRGEEIKELTQAPTWRKIVNIISQQERFNSKTGESPKIAMIDDARTVYSMTELLYDSSTKGHLTSAMPQESAQQPAPTKPQLQEWNHLGFKKEKIGNLLLNADSNALLNMLSKKEVMGAFLYGGDAIFALQGGDVEDPIPIEKNDFHTVKPDKLIYFLDSLVISKTIPKDKESKLYEFIKKLMFEGFESQHSEGMFEKEQNSDDQEKTYKHWPAKNFNYVYYTPTLKKMSDKLKSDTEIYATENESDGNKTPDPHLDIKKQMLLIENDVPVIPAPTKPKIFYEGYMNHTETTDLNIEYDNWKSKF